MSNPFADYGQHHRMQPWYNTEKYFASRCWEKVFEGEDRRLTTLRPSLATLRRKENLVGVEIGVGRCVNSLNILDNLDIKELHLIDLVVPPGVNGREATNDPRTTFWHGDSMQLSKQLPDELDFVYLDASHDYDFILNEVRIVLPKLKRGGLIGGHDYEQIGVATAVATLQCNLWRHLKEKPCIEVESCRDNHPGYPEEYIETGFPLDWWYVKDNDLTGFEIFDLRNG